jgi:hypothetical protein
MPMKIAFAFLLTLVMISSCSTKKDDQEEKPPVTTLPFHGIRLDDLSAFKALKGKNWLIGGNAYMNRQVALHVETAEGKGVLINNAPEGSGENLFTSLEHGDLDLELDFMLPKGSYPGIFFQGRYELLLSDSWKKDSVGFADCGGIGQRLENEKGVEGSAPLINACKAPGLWQHLYVSFKAPRFDKSGKKITNAFFEKVILNGKLVQQHVQVSGPTGSAVLTDEKSSGPLVFRGDRGPVAYRNIGFKAYKDARVTLSDMKYEVYKGLYKNYDTLVNFKPERTGTTDSLTWRIGDKRAQLVIKGKMHIDNEGDYLFKIRGGGPAFLLIDDKEIVNNQGTRDYQVEYFGSVNLKSGDHSFQVIHANYDECLVLEYEGPEIPFTLLTTPSSERLPHAIEPLEYELNGKPAFQRGFFTHHNKVDPYTMTVGIPGNINYAYDMSTSSMLSAWHGKYVDVSNMWTERGESQMQVPLGAPIEFGGKPALAVLDDPAEGWPDSVLVDNNMYTDRGYRLEPGGLPVFLYSYNNVRLEDFISAEKDNSGLVRHITTQFGQPAKNMYFLLGDGKKVEKLAEGVYAIDDKQYYIELTNKADGKKLSVVNGKNGLVRLILPLTSEGNNTVSFSYSIIW